MGKSIKLKISSSIKKNLQKVINPWRRMENLKLKITNQSFKSILRNRLGIKKFLIMEW